MLSRVIMSSSIDEIITAADNMEKQRVVVIQDTSRDMNPNPLRWALDGLLLKPGDKLTLVGVLHEVITPMGYKIKVDTASKLGANMRIIKDAAEAKKNEYHNNSELAEITQLFEAQKVEFIIKVVAGTSRKDMVIEAAQNQKATWIILDRYMKKDERYILQKLSCGISRMKNHFQVEELRGSSASVTNGNIRPTITENRNGIRDDETIIPRSSSLTVQEVFNINVLPAIPEMEEVAISITENRNGIRDDETILRSSSSTVQEVFNISVLPAIPEMDEMEEMEEMEEVAISESVENISDSVSKNDDDSVSKNGDGLMQLVEGSTSLNGGEIPRSTSVHTPEEGGTLNLTIECKINFTYEELHAATDGFSPDNSLCDGVSIYGFVGKLENELKIVVRKSKSLILGVEDFEFETNVMRKARHKNIVRLIGFCSEENHRLIVYESACNGLLRESILEESPRLLTWDARIKVALGAARGLLFLHENRLIHNNIRSNNIFLTHELDPLVGYFSLAKTKYESDDSSEYRAPEYEELGIVSSKTDVYSFGIVLLELISGRVTTQQTANESNILSWARPLLKNRNYEELLDPRLVSSHDSQQLYRMVRVTQLCLAKNPKRRLTMDRVVSALEFIWASESCSNFVGNGIPITN